MAWDNRNLRCRNCRFWWPNAEGGGDPDRERAIIGQCRRYAPSAMVVDLPDHTRRYPAWATTKREDWCGEHSHLEM